MKTLHLRKSIGRFLPALSLIALACFAFLPTARAVLPSPTPDGGYINQNTAEGTNALFHLTTTGNNPGVHNTAIGFQALASNTSGSGNTATGHNALASNTTGIGNTAAGGGALASNGTGHDNTASGQHALNGNTSGYQNTADGSTALGSNTTGIQNTATGFEALASNTTAGSNTADGFEALINNTGGNNIALGAQAGFHLTTGSNNIDIGNMGVAAETHTIRIGTTGAQTKTFIAGIRQAAVTGATVVISVTGQLGTVSSSERFKADIKPMDKASEAVLALKPVTFHYKQDVDPEGAPQFGLVAEQVEKVDPDLVTRDAEGKIYTVRYDAVNAMLLNEFLKEHRKVQDLEKQVEKLTAGLQKVSDQVALTKSMSHVIVSDQ
jgi:hypothetical protein